MLTIGKDIESTFFEYAASYRPFQTIHFRPTYLFFASFKPNVLTPPFEYLGFTIVSTISLAKSSSKPIRSLHLWVDLYKSGCSSSWQDPVTLHFLKAHLIEKLYLGSTPKLSDMEELLNPASDPGLIDQVVEAAFNTQGPQQKQAMTILTQFQEQPDAWQKVPVILDSSNSQQAKVSGLSLRYLSVTHSRSSPPSTHDQVSGGFGRHGGFRSSLLNRSFLFSMICPQQVHRASDHGQGRIQFPSSVGLTHACYTDSMC